MGGDRAGILSAVARIDEDGADPVYRRPGTLPQHPAQLVGSHGRDLHRPRAPHDVADEQRFGAIHQHPRRAHAQSDPAVTGGQHAELPYRVPLQHRAKLRRELQQIHAVGRRYGGSGACHGRLDEDGREQASNPPERTGEHVAPVRTRRPAGDAWASVLIFFPGTE